MVLEFFKDLFYFEIMCMWEGLEAPQFTCPQRPEEGVWSRDAGVAEAGRRKTGELRSELWSSGRAAKAALILLSNP